MTQNEFSARRLTLDNMRPMQQLHDLCRTLSRPCYIGLDAFKIDHSLPTFDAHPFIRGLIIGSHDILVADSLGLKYETIWTTQPAMFENMLKFVAEHGDRTLKDIHRDPDFHRTRTDGL